MEEQATTTLISPGKVQEHPNSLEFRKSTPATVVNLWVRSFNKWLDILDKFKKEARLINQLITLSLHGEEFVHLLLKELHKKLNVLIQSDLKALEIEILDMQQNLDLLQRYVINTDVKMREIKIKIQRFSNAYGDLKMTIFRELTKIYPSQII